MAGLQTGPAMPMEGLGINRARPRQGWARQDEVGGTEGFTASQGETSNRLGLMVRRRAQRAVSNHGSSTSRPSFETPSP